MIALEIIKWADLMYLEKSSDASIDAVIENIERMNRITGPKGYFATHICALILSGCVKSAQKKCESAIEKGECGGYAVAFGQTFPEMAIDWIARRDTAGEY